MKVDYQKIYEFLRETKMKFIDASSIEHFIGVERIYGATMMKLVREGYLEFYFKDSGSGRNVYKIIK